MTMIARRMHRFAADDAGSITMWMIAWMIGLLMFIGLAVDSGNGYRTKAMLQVTANAASHAGAVTLGRGGTSFEAVNAAQNIAQANVPGTVRASDVEFGRYDGGVFTAGIAPVNAVRVTARRDETASNGLETHFLRIIGIDTLDVAASAVTVFDPPPCENDGIIAMGQVKFTAQAAFDGAVCIHSQTELQISGIDSISADTVFSAPNVAPHNEGGMVNASTGVHALLEGHLEPDWLLPDAALEDEVRKAWKATLAAIQGYASKPNLVEATPVYAYREVQHGAGKNNWDIVQDIADGYRYFYLTCKNGSNRFDFPSEVVDLRGVTIVSTCALAVNGADTVLMKDTTIMVDDPGNEQSIKLNGKSSVADTATSCVDYGDIKLYSTGGVKMTAESDFTGIEIVATGSVSLAADADLTAGLSIQSQGSVELTAKATIQDCIYSPNDQKEFDPVYRIVL